MLSGVSTTALKCRRSAEPTPKERKKRKRKRKSRIWQVERLPPSLRAPLYRPHVALSFPSRRDARRDLQNPRLRLFFGFFDASSHHRPTGGAGTLNRFVSRVSSAHRGSEGPPRHAAGDSQLRALKQCFSSTGVP